MYYLLSLMEKNAMEKDLEKEGITSPPFQHYN
jgi:hypothetical protein